MAASPPPPDQVPRHLIGVLIAALCLLSGCFAVHVSARVSSDDTVSGTAQFGVSKALAEATGGKDALLKQLRGQRPCAFGGTSTDYDDGTFVGVRCPFSRISIASFNTAFATAPGGGPTLSREGGQFRLSGRFDLQQVLSSSPLPGETSPGGDQVVPSPELTPGPSDSDGPTQLPSDLSSLLPPALASLIPTPLPSDLSSLLPSGALPSDADGLDPKALLSGVVVRFAFTFPGPVRSSAGTVDGSSVTFGPDAAGRIDFTTVADAAATPHTGTIAGYHARLDAERWALAAAVVVAGLLLAVAARRRQLRQRRAHRQARLQHR